MANQEDLSQLSDDELMEKWTAAGEAVAQSQAECDAYAAEYHVRLQKAEEQRLAAKVPSADDQIVGSVE